MKEIIELLVNYKWYQRTGSVYLHNWHSSGEELFIKTTNYYGIEFYRREENAHKLTYTEHSIDAIPYANLIRDQLKLDYVQRDKIVEILDSQFREKKTLIAVLYFNTITRLLVNQDKEGNIIGCEINEFSFRLSKH